MAIDYGALVCTREGGMWYSPSPYSVGMPTWTQVSNAITVRECQFKPDNPAALQLAHDGSNTYVRRAVEGADYAEWESSLTLGELRFITGEETSVTSAAVSETGVLAIAAQDPLTEGGQYVLTSTNGGESWQVIFSPDFGSQNRGWGGLAFGRVNSDIIVVTGTSGILSYTGIWVSTDGGTSWSDKLALDPESGYKAWVFASPDPNTFYAGEHEGGIGNTMDLLRTKPTFAAQTEAETILQAFASGGSLYTAKGTRPVVGDKYALLADSVDFTGGEMAAAKGDTPVAGDIFVVDDADVGSEAIDYVLPAEWTWSEIDGALQAAPVHTPTQGSLWIPENDTDWIYTTQDDSLFWGTDGTINNSRELDYTISAMAGLLDTTSDTATLLLGRWELGIDENFLFRTSDDGETLTEVSGDIPTSVTGIARQGIASLGCVEIVGASLSPRVLKRGTGDEITASLTGEDGVTPTLPSYLWTPAPASGQGDATATYNFSAIGPQNITMRASNACSVLEITKPVCICGTLRELVYYTLTNCSGITDIVGARIYPDRVPENATYPLLVYHAPITDSDVAMRTHDRATDRSVATVQLDCYGQSFPGASGAYGGDQAEELAYAVVDCVNGASGPCCCIGYQFVDNRIAERQDNLNEYRQIIDVTFEYRRITS